VVLPANVQEKESWENLLHTCQGPIPILQPGHPYSYAGMQVDYTVQSTTNHTWQHVTTKLQKKIKSLRLNGTSLKFREHISNTFIIGTIRYYIALLPTNTHHLQQITPLVRSVLALKRIPGGLESFIQNRNALNPNHLLYLPIDFAVMEQAKHTFKQLVLPISTLHALNPREHWYPRCMAQTTNVPINTHLFALMAAELYHVYGWPTLHSKPHLTNLHLFNSSHNTTLIGQWLSSFNNHCPTILKTADLHTPLFHNVHFSLHQTISIPKRVQSCKCQVLRHLHIGSEANCNFSACTHFPKCPTAIHCKQISKQPRKYYKISMTQCDSTVPIYGISTQQTLQFKTISNLGNPKYHQKQTLETIRTQPTHRTTVPHKPDTTQQFITQWKTVDLSGNPVLHPTIQHNFHANTNDNGRHPLVFHTDADLPQWSENSKITQWTSVPFTKFPLHCQGIVPSVLQHAEVWLHPTITQNFHLTYRHSLQLALCIPQILKGLSTLPHLRPCGQT